tara:strand:+ start:564 stop:1091 length:528 start_codon:yes stop_codon:yes gene_type:complete
MVTPEILKCAVTNTEENLYGLSNQSPVLLIFLRHLGCIFCQEALKDLSNLKSKMDLSHVKIVFVHMAELNVAEEYFDELELDVDYHISDPDCNLYEKFGLVKATTRELFSFQVMLKSSESALVRGNWPKAKRIGDGFQMPGVFTINSGEIVDSYIHKRISDRPNYSKMIDCCGVG